MRIESASIILLAYSIFIIDLQADIGVKKKKRCNDIFLLIYTELFVILLMFFYIEVRLLHTAKYTMQSTYMNKNYCIDDCYGHRSQRMLTRYPFG